jgi:hypothetical protein
MTTDRHAVEADLVRDHLPLTSWAVNDLARRLPALSPWPGNGFARSVSAA